jgi:hypothetical protein
VASAASTRRHSTELDDRLNEFPSSINSQDLDDEDDNDDDDNDVAMPQNVSCISPDMPSCASGMSGSKNSLI